MAILTLVLLLFLILNISISCIFILWMRVHFVGEENNEKYNGKARYDPDEIVAHLQVYDT